MATKTLTITNEAYERLATLKQKKESFSDVINKLTVKHFLLDLAGIISKNEAKRLKRSISDVRKRMREGTDKTAASLQ